MNSKLNSYMVQYGLWTNCCNNCDFCLRRVREPEDIKTQLHTLEYIKRNITHIDWMGKYSAGISLLGGEIYYIKDKQLQDSFMDLIDIIIKRIIKVSPNPMCKYSTVTNGIYDPEFLYRVMDKLFSEVNPQHIDVNFSYDLKYRYKNESDRLLVLKNINDFHNRYDYSVGIQMILTQNVINLWKYGEFDINDFIQQNFPGNSFAFLYPHKIFTGKVLDDFFFSRHDFLEFLRYLRDSNSEVYRSFILSAKHSSLFKYTGYKNRGDNEFQQPVLCDDKEIMNECGHSILYQCYSDCDKCMMCDLYNLEPDLL